MFDLETMFYLENFEIPDSTRVLFSPRKAYSQQAKI